MYLGFLQKTLACIALIALSPLHAAVIIQLKIVEGEGTVYPSGSRATRGITVLVTDESGGPVEGATVSFRLPEDGPGGTFSGGLHSEVVTTKADGRATIWGMQWNKTPGPFDVRITAAKDQARAGIVSRQYLGDQIMAKSGGSGGSFERPHHSRKWLLIGAVAAAGAAGFAVSRSQSGKTASIAPTLPIQIGSPSITIGH